ncbi:hypothetical protein JOM56_002748 [Amanita muscaria]
MGSVVPVIDYICRLPCNVHELGVSANIDPLGALKHVTLYGKLSDLWLGWKRNKFNCVNSRLGLAMAKTSEDMKYGYLASLVPVPRVNGMLGTVVKLLHERQEAHVLQHSLLFVLCTPQIRGSLHDTDDEGTAPPLKTLGKESSGSWSPELVKSTHMRVTCIRLVHQTLSAMSLSKIVILVVGQEVSGPEDEKWFLGACDVTLQCSSKSWGNMRTYADKVQEDEGLFKEEGDANASAIPRRPQNHFLVKLGLWVDNAPKHDVGPDMQKAEGAAAVAAQVNSLDKAALVPHLSEHRDEPDKICWFHAFRLVLLKNPKHSIAKYIEGKSSIGDGRIFVGGY